MLLLFALHSFSLSAVNKGFERQWKQMQTMYKSASESFSKSLNDNFTHQNWREYRTNIKRLIQGKPDTSFLRFPAIMQTMVRMDYGTMQDYELLFLKNCISKRTTKKIGAFKDTQFGSLPLAIKDFNCTVNSLGQLYYMARILEFAHNEKLRLNTIVEFGAGYGNLARIVKMIDPQATVILIDFPELLAIQNLYLNATLANQKIVVHNNVPQQLQTGAIHLIPIYIADKLSLNADCFVSTFALSESPIMVQKLMLSKNFFNASICYITGQIDGWKKNKKIAFEAHQVLHDGVRSLYKQYQCQPFHSLFQPGALLPSYEIVALQ
jgi:putative sugar O-methyltransferase